MSKKRKYTSNSFSVDVDIDTWELLEALSDDDLLEEIKERELSFTKAQVDSIEARDEVLQSIHEMLRDGNADEALLTVERFLFPKYPSVAACEEKLKEIRAAKTVSDHQSDAN